MEEKLRYLVDGDLGMLCDAAYWWLSANHVGQWSPEYVLLCKIGRIYRPSRSAWESAYPELTNLFDEYYLVACDVIERVFDDLI